MPFDTNSDPPRHAVPGAPPAAGDGWTVASRALRGAAAGGAAEVSPLTGAELCKVVSVSAAVDVSDGVFIVCAQSPRSTGVQVPIV